MTGPSSAREPSTRPIAADDVADYLRRNPDFLRDRQELLSVLTPPSRPSGDGVVDMQQFMIERLRDEVRRLNTRHDELLASARGTMAGHRHVHESVLDILSARTFEDAIQAITVDLAARLELDAVTICIESHEPQVTPATKLGVRVLKPGTVDSVLGAGKKVILRPSVRGEARLFGQSAQLIRSDALLRLEVSPMTPTGVLALGTRSEGHFQSGQGTENLVFLARIVEVSIRQWLDLPG